MLSYFVLGLPSNMFLNTSIIPVTLEYQSMVKVNTHSEWVHTCIIVLLNLQIFWKLISMI